MNKARLAQLRTAVIASGMDVPDALDVLGVLYRTYPGLAEKVHRDERISRYVARRLAQGFSKRYTFRQAAELFDVDVSTIERSAKSTPVFAVTLDAPGMHNTHQED